MFKLVSLISGLALASTLSAQVEPRAGQWKTWVIASGSALRLPAPPDVAGTAAEIQWVKSCVAARTQANLAQVRFWDAGAPGYRWMQLTEQLAVSTHGCHVPASGATGVGLLQTPGDAANEPAKA